MRRLILVLAPLLIGLMLASVALAGSTTYAGPRQWWAGEGAGSSFSSSWFYNHFFKHASGYDTTVTMIDNVSYGWHDTVRNSSSVTYTFKQTYRGTIKGHCRAHVGGFSGSCVVST